VTSNSNDKGSFFILSLALTSCRTTTPPTPQRPVPHPVGLVYPSSETKEQTDQRLAREINLSEKYKADYFNRWAAYTCDKSEIPDAQTYKIDFDHLKPILLSRDLQLILKLGRAVKVDAERLRFRTESRHILKNAFNKELARGESKITGLGQGSARVIHNPSSKCVLVDEELSGVGDVVRHIVFVRLLDMGNSAASNALVVWKAFYVNLPVRGQIGEGSFHGHILSITPEKIYVETDGIFYAFTIKDFIDSTLEFSMG